MRPGPFLLAIVLAVVLLTSLALGSASRTTPAAPAARPVPGLHAEAVGSLMASAKPVPADVGATLNFYGIYSGIGPPTTLNWSFGDGTYSSAQYPVHAYVYAENYTVVFTVRNATYSNSTTIYVLINPDVQTGGSYSPTNPTTATVVNFTLIPSLGTPPYIGFWRFGDGTTGTGLTAQHTFHTAGTYTVTAWANDSGEGSAKFTVQVVVTKAPGGGGGSSGGSTTILIGTSAAAAAVAVGGFAYFQWDKKRRPKRPSLQPPPPT